MKIAIIGNAGSGKSTLGLILHKILGIPLYHLDQYQWQPGWQKTDLEEFKQLHDQLCDKSEWIIEGCATRFFEYRINKADIVIFLDMPRYLCLYRVFKRAFTHFGHVFFSSAKGCRESFPSFDFLNYIVWRFPRKKKPEILELMNTYKDQKQLFIVKNQTEFTNLIQKFETTTQDIIMSSQETSKSIEITATLATEFIAEQFPQWAHLEVSPVALSGIDNRTFRLGEELLVRLPSAEQYAEQVQKEQTWLPLLTPHISVAIPNPLALGKPSKEYPWHWSIYRWIEGQSANTISFDEGSLSEIAADLAQFLNELHKIDAADGPVPGPHNFWRGGNLSVYDTETRSALKELQNVIDTDAATAVWEKALSSTWRNNPVWIHGDLSSGNILIKDGKLIGVIDFGCMGIGDPACDLVIAWTLLTNKSRKTFKSHVGLDPETWARARGWALWKALITLASLKDKTSEAALKNKQIIDEIINETSYENDPSPDSQ